jgi:acyl-CoA thioesterase YciA
MPRQKSSPLNPAIRARAMPADTNLAGDIFGGWIVSHMDLAGEIAARQRARTRVVTVAIHTMEFHRPVHVGDVVSFFTEIEKVGRTSVSVRIRAEAMSEETGKSATVTEGLFVYVALGEDEQPTPVDSRGVSHK